MKIPNIKSGYTLLFAVLTASLVLGVAAFILGIARKQYILSSTARDSLYSFYAADAGMECIAKNAQSTELLFGTSTTGGITCSGEATPRSVSFVASMPEGSYTVYKASTNFGFSAEGSIWGCALVDIYQKYDGDTLKATVIESRGYNLCQKDSATPANYSPQESSRTVERALRLVIQ